MLRVGYRCAVLGLLCAVIIHSALAAVSIPVVHHVSRDSQGLHPVVSDADLDAAMQRLNAAYNGMGLFFYSYEQRFIDRDDWHAGWETDKYWPDLQELSVSNALNIFHLNALKSNGRANFPFRQRDYLFVKAARLDHTTLIHEVGHYFGLIHTFSRSRRGAYCWNSADLLCDTAEDPGLPRRDFDPKTCEYLGQQQLMAMPPSRNYMSYGPASCRDHFTPEQKARIQHTLINDRFYLGQQIGEIYQQSFATVSDFPHQENFTPRPWQAFSWQNAVVGDSANWTVDPISSHSRVGPKQAQVGRHFAFLNSRAGEGAHADLLSPWYQTTELGMLQLCFHYQTEAEDHSSLALFSRTNTDSWTLLWHTGQHSNGWQQHCLTLPPAGAVQLKFSGTLGDGKASSLALDALRVSLMK